mmetsp:Transcript_40576/g.107243  ORF Transcript_40576/g.107243 Transcript_40576/m.107243 type:complete len:258 (-) Transcript_40576:974-1747(-)
MSAIQNAAKHAFDTPPHCQGRKLCASLCCFHHYHNALGVATCSRQAQTLQSKWASTHEWHWCLCREMPWAVQKPDQTLQGLVGYDSKLTRNYRPAPYASDLIQKRHPEVLTALVLPGLRCAESTFLLAHRQTTREQMACGLEHLAESRERHRCLPSHPTNLPRMGRMTEIALAVLASFRKTLSEAPLASQLARVLDMTGARSPCFARKEAKARGPESLGSHAARVDSTSDAGHRAHLEAQALGKPSPGKVVNKLSSS